MRHNTKTVDDAMAALDWLDRIGITVVRPADFQPVKFGGRTFGQLQAVENKLTTAGVDQVLSDQATLTPVAKSMPVVEPLASFFSATKVSETDTEILFRVRIKRGERTSQQLLDVTKHVPYTNSTVVLTMPLTAGKGEDWEEFDYVMFKVGRQISDSQVEKERTKRHFTRDIEIQILLNAIFPEFADDWPNGDSWQDENGAWCFASFVRRGVLRCLFVDRYANDWIGHYWFGGRKSYLIPSLGISAKHLSATV